MSRLPRAEAGERCERTELLTTECSHCRGLDRQPAPARRPGNGPGPWFPAAYPGRCSQCATSFDPGDRIRAAGGGGYLAECCGEDEDHA
jgi:hypothetical protein